MTKCDKLKKIDVHGLRIEMTYNGRRRYTTVCGAIITLISAVIILELTISGYLYIDNIETSFEMLKHLDIRDDDSPTFNPKEGGFDMAVGYDHPNFEKYGRIKFNHV